MSTLRNTAAKPPQRRHMARVVTAFGSAVAAGILALTTACADGAPTGPREGTAGSGLLSPVVPILEPVVGALPLGVVAPTVTGTLTRTVPLAGPITASAVIGPEGGSVAIPEAGVKLLVDSGTVLLPTTFSVTALAGSVVAYEFTPHGLYPAGHLKIRQAIAGTSAETWSQDKDKSKIDALRAGYFADARAIDQQRGQAVVSEVLPVSTDLKNKWIEFKVNHFSGYLMSTGRTAQ